MNILLATMRVHHSGAGIPSYNQELIRLLGHDNRIWVLGETEECDVPGCEGCFTTAGHSFGDYDYCRRLIEKINNSGYDCVIASGSRFIPVIAPFLKVPVLSVSHFVNGRFAKMAGYNAGYQNGLIALSSYGKDFLVNKFDIDDPDMVSVIYNFVNKSESTSNVNKAAGHPLKIVYPGGTSLEKSVEVIQKLVYRLLRSDLDFEFYWLGITTPMPADKYSLLGIKKTPDLFNKDPRLKITGLLPRKEAEKIISEANIFVLPSRGEGCPMSLLEALREGCIPVISDARHGSLEIIEKSATGIIVPQGSDRKLFEAVRDIILSPGEYEHMYEESRTFLSTYLSPEKWGERMREAIDKAVARKKKFDPLSEKLFRKSYLGFKRQERYERLREMARNGWYRILMESAYVKSKLGCYSPTINKK